MGCGFAFLPSVCVKRETIDFLRAQHVYFYTERTIRVYPDGREEMVDEQEVWAPVVIPRGILFDLPPPPWRGDIVCKYLLADGREYYLADQMEVGFPARSPKKYLHPFYCLLDVGGEPVREFLWSEEEMDVYMSSLPPEVRKQFERPR